MRARPSSPLKVTLVSLVVLVAMALPGVAAGSPAPPATQSDPGSTEPADPAPSVPDPTAEPTEDQVVVEEVDTEEAQRRADEDLREVWVVVGALGAVALGLLVLLVLYVRATKPERAGARRQARLAKAQARARRKAGLPDEPQDDDPVAGATPPARVPRAQPVLTLPGLHDDEEDEEGGAGDRGRSDALTSEEAPPPVARPARQGATRRPTDGDRVAAEAASPAPVSADGPTTVLSRHDDRDSDEGVKVIGTAARSAGSGPATPGKPRRRVDTPPKKLGTPDAERVLVRPGQPPVRVPAPQPGEKSPAEPTPDPSARRSPRPSQDEPSEEPSPEPDDDR